MVFNFMKTLDPGSVVRESEYATAENARGVPSTVRNLYNRVVDGLRLTDEQRDDFLETGAVAYLGQLEQQNRKRAQLTVAHSEAGLNPKATLLDYVDHDLAARFAGGAAPPGSVGVGMPQLVTPTAAPATPPPVAPVEAPAPVTAMEATGLDFGAMPGEQLLGLDPTGLSPEQKTALAAEMRRRAEMERATARRQAEVGRPEAFAGVGGG